MSGRHQATFISMLIMVAVVTEANTIGRYPESSDHADYVLALGRQSNCPTCATCPAAPICTSCPIVISTSSLTTCLSDPNIAKSSSATGTIDVSAIPNGVKCNFAIATLPSFTKLRFKCTTITTVTIKATHFGLADLTAAVDLGADTPILSPAAFVVVAATANGGAAKCTWSSE